MKRLSLWLFVLLFAVAAPALAQDPEPVYGGEVVVAITADPPGWDPTVSTSQEIPRVTYHNVYEGLVRFDRDGAIVPALAERWETSEDGLTWTFHIREGVKFHDGSNLQLSDITAKFERARDPESGHTNPGYYAAIESVAEGEGNTVVFTLSEPSSSLLYNLARPDSIIYPAALQETQRSQPVGTGPFRFVSYLEGSEVRLERFEDYYLDGVPFLDAVTFRIIPDANARFAALQAGDIDIIGVALPPEQYLQLADLPGLKGTEGTATTEITLALNNSREPFSDVRVRRAITHAIDKETIVQGAMFGLGEPIGTHMSPAEPYYIDLTVVHPYNPERARELLAEAGYPDGFTVDFELPEPYNIERRTGEVIAQQLAEVGITVNLSVVEWSTWINRIFLGGDYDMTIIGHSEPRDIGVYANPDYYYRYDNPRIGELLDEIERTQDEREQTRLFQEIAEIIAEDAVNVWVFSPPYLVAAQEDVYGFWTNQPTPAIDMTEVYRAQ
jgi:peptide/nickel transport system substrate-binding protein